jgi:hypothetical protein
VTRLTPGRGTQTFKQFKRKKTQVLIVLTTRESLSSSNNRLNGSHNGKRRHNLCRHNILHIQDRYP